MKRAEVLKKLEAELEAHELEVAERLLEEVPEDDFSEPEVFKNRRGEVYAVVKVPVPEGAARFAFSEFFFVLWITGRFVSLRWRHPDGGENGHTKFIRSN